MLGLRNEVKHLFRCEKSFSDICISLLAPKMLYVYANLTIKGKRQHSQPLGV